MSDAGTKYVDIVLNTKKDKNLIQPFDQLAKVAGDTNRRLEQAAEGNARAMGKSSNKMLADITRLDRGLRGIHHGFQGLTANLIMMNTQAMASGGHMSKLAEQTQKTFSYFMMIHSGLIVIKGAAQVTMFAAGATATYTAAALAATGANKLLAKSHYDVAAGAATQALAQRAASGPMKFAGWGRAVPSPDNVVPFAAAGGVGGGVLVAGIVVAGSIMALFFDKLWHAFHGRQGSIQAIWDAWFGESAQAMERAAKKRQADLLTRKSWDRHFGREEEINEGQDRFREIQRKNDLNLVVDRLGTGRFFENRQSNEGREEIQRLRERSLMPGANQQAFRNVETAMREHVMGGLGAAKGTGETEAARLQAFKEFETRKKQKEDKFDQLQQVHRELAKDGNNIGLSAEREKLEREYKAILDKEVDAKNALIAAERAHGLAERDRLDGFRKFAKESSQFYKDEAQRRKDAMKEGGIDFLMMDPLKQKQLLDISRKFKAGEKISGPDWELAQGFGPAREAFRGQLGAQVEGNKGAQEIFKNFGEQDRIKRAEKQARDLEKIAVQIDQKIQAEININEGALADEVNKKLVPLIKQALLAVPILIDQKIQKAFREAQIGKPG